MKDGLRRERQLRKSLEGQGWFVTRAAGSLGDADLIAIKNGEIRLIECKANEGSPWKSCGPEKRMQLRLAARQTGGRAFIVHWPSRKDPVWYDEDSWPT